MSLTPPPEPIRGAAPSTKHVYRILQLADGPATQSELIAYSDHAPKTVRSALNELLDAGLAEEKATVDARSVRYELVSSEK